MSTGGGQGVRNNPGTRAPLWLVHLVRLRPVPVPWTAGARAVVALALPMAVATAIGRVEWGALVSAGALSIVLADRDGPYRLRAIRLSAAAVAATAGYTLGVLGGGSTTVSSLVVVGLAMMSVLISAAGPNSSTAGLMLLVFGVVGTGTHEFDVGLDVRVGGFALGVLWSLAVALSGWTVRGTHPERTAVAQVFVELAAMLSARDERTSRAARHQLTVAMNAAYDRLLPARARVPGRDAVYRSLLTTLSQATPVVEAAVAMVDENRATPPEVTDHLTRIAVAVLADAEPPTGFRRPEPGADSGALDALYTALERFGSGRERVPDAPTPFLTWARELLAAYVPDRATGIAMLRLTVCVAIAEAVGAALPFEHSYWIALTVGIVLKPELGSIFGRAVLRGIGTVVGVVLAAAVLFAHPNGWVLVILSAVFAAGVPIGKTLNYGILSASVTPLIIFQLDIRQLGDPTLVMERLVDTLIGCLIVLVAGYWLWPGSTAPRVAGRMADALDRVREYVQVGLVPMDSDEDTIHRSRARRRAYRTLADLRTAFAEALVEPSAAGRHATNWWPAVVMLEQITDTVTAMVVAADRDGSWPAAEESGAVEAALFELAAAVREHRKPVLHNLPVSSVLSTVAEQLTEVADTLSSPGD